jgi:hypothetical protein
MNMPGALDVLVRYLNPTANRLAIMPGTIGEDVF